MTGSIEPFMVRLKCRLLFLFAILAVASAFADNPNIGHADTQRRAVSAPAPSSAPDVPTDPDHVLQAQDVLRVQVFQEDDISKQCDGIPVSQELTLTLPLIGVLDVKGKTIGQLQQLIHDLYDKDYLVNPQVTVVVLKYADRWVNLIGAVTNQGHVSFPTQRDLSIVDAIALAGGQTRLADLTQVNLTRVNDHGVSELSIIDVNAMMKKTGAQPLMLKPGDIIFVPERVF